MSSPRPLLGTIPNRILNSYTVRVSTDELTFMGAPDQPDFGSVEVDYIPGDLLLELKSWKKYVQGFRSWHGSYERIASVFHDDLCAVLLPRRLRVRVTFKTRGGSTAQVTVPTSTGVMWP